MARPTDRLSIDAIGRARRLAPLPHVSAQTGEARGAHWGSAIPEFRVVACCLGSSGFVKEALSDAFYRFIEDPEVLDGAAGSAFQTAERAVGRAEALLRKQHGLSLSEATALLDAMREANHQVSVLHSNADPRIQPILQDHGVVEMLAEIVGASLERMSEALLETLKAYRAVESKTADIFPGSSGDDPENVPTAVRRALDEAVAALQSPDLSPEDRATALEASGSAVRDALQQMRNYGTAEQTNALLTAPRLDEVEIALMVTADLLKST